MKIILVGSVAVSPDGNYIVSGSDDKTVKVWDFLEIKKLERKEKKRSAEKIKEMVGVSNRLKLDMMQRVLKLSLEEFENKIFGWAKQFGFRIDGDYLIINKDTVSDFIDVLNKSFEVWDKKEKDHIDKI